MRSCLTVLLVLAGLSMVVWLGWGPAERYYDRFVLWWQGEDKIIVENVEEPVIESLPAPLLPPVYPTRTRSRNKIVRVTNSIDIPYESLSPDFDFNGVVREYIELAYYDTDVRVYRDTIPGRDALLAEVINLEVSDQRQFYMWNTFDLTVDHELLPNSVLRVFLHLSGEYREEFSPEWSMQQSRQTELRMINVLRGDAEHLLIFLENKLRREGGSLIGW